MPLINKMRYVKQIVLFKTKKHGEYDLKEAKNARISLPFSKYKGSKIIIIHDIDNKGFESELHEMVELEKKKKIKSIFMLLPHTMYYGHMFRNEVGIHETFPYRFKKHYKSFVKFGMKPISFSQHVAIKATNFYPLTLNALPKEIKYAFVDPVSFGYKRNYVLNYRPMKYKNITMLSVVSEPTKKDIDAVLKGCAKEKGVIAFNFHPGHFKKGDKYFPKNGDNFLHLLKKLR